MTLLEDAIDADIATNKQHMMDTLEQARKDNSLQHVYDTLGKYLHINDYNRIDAVLATVLSNKLPGIPIWLFITGRSGDWKSTLAAGINGWHHVRLLDKITTKTLSSGQKKVKDLGSELANNSTIIIFLDMASMTGINKDAKTEIWAQFRNLYDGFVQYDTGNGVSKKYENCHVTLIGCSTDSLKNEILMNSHLGTRELVYDAPDDIGDDNQKMTMAWDNENFQQDMKKEIQQAIHGFLNYHTVNISDDQIPDTVKTQLFKEAKRLAMLRASQATDMKYGELINRVRPETPTRIIQQFKRFYKCLKSLDDDYPDEKALAIIKHIVNSTGNEIRQKIIASLTKEPDRWVTAEDVRKDIGIGRDAVKRQLEIMWNMGVCNMKTEWVNFGGYVRADDMGRESMAGGRWQEQTFYRLSEAWKDAQIPQQKTMEKFTQNPTETQLDVATNGR